jgi:signal transduction histidine kinase
MHDQTHPGAGLQEESVADERLWAMFDELPTAAYLWRRDGDDLRLVAYNAAAARQSEYRAANHLGRSARATYAQEPDVLDDLLRCLRDGSTFGREMDYVVPETGERPRIRVTYASLPSDLVMVSIMNVQGETEIAENLRRSGTELARLLREQSRLQEELRGAADRERERIGADLHAHAIQSLTAVQLRLDALRRLSKDPATADELGDLEREVAAAIRRLRGLTAPADPEP